MSFGAGIAEEAIERAEHVATVLRMRKATIIGLVV